MRSYSLPSGSGKGQGNDEATHQLVTELDCLSVLCEGLQLPVPGQPADWSLLGTLSEALGAETAALRYFSLRSADRVPDIHCIGLPDQVTEAYRDRYYKMDPVIHLLARPEALDTHRPSRSLLPEGMSPLFPFPDAAHADRFLGDRFSRYHREFLLPNDLYHHVGFLLPDEVNQQAWLFNFHRPSRAPAFSEVEVARARLVGRILQQQITAFAAARANQSRPSAPLAALNPREREICEVVGQGLANKQIAATLGISVRTVENHLRNIYRKLGISSRTQLLSLLLKEPLKDCSTAQRGLR